MKKKKKRGTQQFTGTQQNCVETYDIRVETTPKMELEEPALLSMRLGLMGLMILIMVSFTHSFCSIYGIDFFDYPNILLYALFGPVVLYFLYCYLPRRFMADIVALVLLIAIILFNAPRLVSGAQYTANLVIQAINTRTYSEIYGLNLANSDSAYAAVEAFLGTVILLIAWPICRTIMGKCHAWLIAVLTFLPLLPGLSFGLIPTHVMFAGLIIGIIAAQAVHLINGKTSEKDGFFCKEDAKGQVIFTYRSRRQMAGMAGIICVVALTGGMLMFLVGGGIYSESVYQSAGITAIRDQLYEILAGDSGHAWLGIDSGYLGKVENYEPSTTTPYLQVRCANMGVPLYIRSFVGATYSGNRWIPMSETNQQKGHEELDEYFAKEGYYPQNLSSDYLMLNRGDGSSFIAGCFTSPVLLLVRSNCDYRKTFTPYNALYPANGLDGEKLTYDLDIAPQMQANAWSQSYDFTYISTPNVLSTDFTVGKYTSATQAQTLSVDQLVYYYLEKGMYCKLFGITEQDVKDLLPQDVLQQNRTSAQVADLVEDYLTNHENAEKLQTEPMAASMDIATFCSDLQQNLESYFSYFMLSEDEGNEQLLSYSQREEAYAAYVKKNYSAIESGIGDEIKDQFRMGINQTYEDVYGDLQGLTDAVREYLQQNITYDTTDSKLPSGEEFLDYFFTKEKRGYSTLYATAAVVAFRAAGVPARYCEGFVIQPQDFIERDTTQEGIIGQNLATGELLEYEGYYFNLTENYMHAWCEIYVPGYGWYPVEMTPGYSTADTVNPTLKSGKTLIPVVGGTGSDEEDSTYVFPSATKQEVQYDLQDEYALGGMAPMTILRWVIFAIVAVLLFVCVAMGLRRLIVHQKIKAAVHQKNYNRAVCALYGYLDTVLAQVGLSASKKKGYDAQLSLWESRFSVLPPGECDWLLHTMLKAKFSDEEIGYKEYLRCLEDTEHMVKIATRDISALKRIKLAVKYALL